MPVKKSGYNTNGSIIVWALIFAIICLNGWLLLLNASSWVTSGYVGLRYQDTVEDWDFQLLSIITNPQSCTLNFKSQTVSGINGSPISIKLSTGGTDLVIASLNQIRDEVQITRMTLNVTPPNPTDPNFDGNENAYGTLEVEYSPVKESPFLRLKEKVIKQYPIAFAFDLSVISSDPAILKCQSLAAGSFHIAHGYVKNTNIKCSSLRVDGTIQRLLYSGTVSCPPDALAFGGGWDLDTGWYRGLGGSPGNVTPYTNGGICVPRGCTMISKSQGSQSNEMNISVCCYANDPVSCPYLYGAIYALCQKQ